MKKTVIVGLVAAKGAGKDTLALILAQSGYTRIAFADALYSEAAAAYGCTVADMQVRETKETPQARFAPARCSNKEFAEYCLQYLAREGRTGGAEEPMSPREVLQQWGTYRRAEDPEYWLKQVEFVLRRPEAAGGKYVITDVRYANEASCVESAGGTLVRIRRKTAEDAAAGDKHPSETELRERATRYVVQNSGTVQDLEAEAGRLVLAIDAAQEMAA